MDKDKVNKISELPLEDDGQLSDTINQNNLKQA